MKKILLLLMALVISACSVDKPKTYSWQSIGELVNINSPVLAMDSAGVPYLAYSDSANGYKATVKKYNGNNWVAVGGAVSPGKVLQHSLAIDSTGVPYLAFTYIINSSEVALVMKYDEITEAWKSVGGLVNNVGDLNLAMGNNNVPYLAYRDDTDKATVKKYDGNSDWVAVGEVVSDKRLTDLVLEMDSTGVPYIACKNLRGNVDTGTHTYEVTVKKYDGNSWVAVGGRLLGDKYGSDFDLEIDNNNVPYLAYRDDTAKVTVKKYDGNSWVAVGGGIVSDEYVADINLVMGNNNVSYLVYGDDTYKDTYKATVKKYDGNNWVAVGGVVSYEYVADLNLVMGNNNVPYLAYSDETDKATVKKYDVIK